MEAGSGLLRSNCGGGSESGLVLPAGVLDRRQSQSVLLIGHDGRPPTVRAGVVQRLELRTPWRHPQYQFRGDLAQNIRLVVAYRFEPMGSVERLDHQSAGPGVRVDRHDLVEGHLALCGARMCTGEEKVDALLSRSPVLARLFHEVGPGDGVDDVAIPFDAVALPAVDTGNRPDDKLVVGQPPTGVVEGLGDRARFDLIGGDRVHNGSIGLWDPNLTPRGQG